MRGDIYALIFRKIPTMESEKALSLSRTPKTIRLRMPGYCEV